MKKLLILIVILSSCSQQKRCLKHFEKAKAGGCVVTDTVFIKGETVKGQTVVELDSVKLDSIAQVLADQYQELLDNCKDTSKVKQQKAKIKQLIQQIPCRINPVDTSSTRYSLKMWIENGILMYDLDIKDIKQSIDCPKCPEPPWWDNWLLGFCCGLSFMFLILCLVSIGVKHLVNRKNYLK